MIQGKTYTQEIYHTSEGRDGCISTPSSYSCNRNAVGSEESWYITQAQADVCEEMNNQQYFEG